MDITRKAGMTKKAGMIALALVLIALASIVVMLTQTEAALAEDGDIIYIDEKGYEKTLERSEYTEVNSGKSATLNEGWHVVKGNVNISGKLFVSGRAKLVLCNGARLNVQKGIVSYSTLTVFGCSVNPEECGQLYAISDINDPAIGNTKSKSFRGELVVYGGRITAVGKGRTVPAIGGPGFSVRFNSGTLETTGYFGIGSSDSSSPAKLILRWMEEEYDSVKISSYKNVNVELVDDFLYSAPEKPEDDTVAAVPLIDGDKLVPVKHNWVDLIYRVITKEGTNIPAEIEVSAICTRCHRVYKETKPVKTDVLPDGVIHYYTNYFDNPVFGYWEFYDDGQRGDAVVFTTTPKKKTIKASTLKKKAVKFSLKTKVQNGKAKSIKYKKTSGSKKITVSSAGKVTVKKGLKKGTYKFKVKLTATLTTGKKETDVKTLKVVVK